MKRRWDLLTISMMSLPPPGLLEKKFEAPAAMNKKESPPKTSVNEMTSAPQATVTEKNCERHTTPDLGEWSLEEHGDGPCILTGVTARTAGSGISNCDTEAPGEVLNQPPLRACAPASTDGCEEPLTVD